MATLQVSFLFILAIYQSWKRVCVCVCVFAGFESMLWKVPITVATKGNPQATSLVLTQQSVTVTLEGVAEGEWVLVSE